MYLIAPADLVDGDFPKFSTEFSFVMKYVKYSKDKQKLLKLAREDAAFRSISRKTANMVNVLTNSTLRFKEGEERVDMCEAIEEIRNDGVKEGMEKGMEKGMLGTLAGLVKKGLLTVAQAAEEARMSVSEFEAKAELIA